MLLIFNIITTFRFWLNDNNGVENGVFMLVKYKGAVDYFPDRLFVEFQDIDQNSWVMKWIICHIQP